MIIILLQIKLFMSVGGTNLKIITLGIMRKAMTDEVAQNFSFTGKKRYKELKKTAFISTQLYSIIHSKFQNKKTTLTSISTQIFKVGLISFFIFY